MEQDASIPDRNENEPDRALHQDQITKRPCVELLHEYKKMPAEQGELSTDTDSAHPIAFIHRLDHLVSWARLGLVGWIVSIIFAILLVFYIDKIRCENRHGHVIACVGNVDISTGRILLLGLVTLSEPMVRISVINHAVFIR